MFDGLSLFKENNAGWCFAKKLLYGCMDISHQWIVKMAFPIDRKV
jgi:hypothetical protein